MRPTSRSRGSGWKHARACVPLGVVLLAGCAPEWRPTPTAPSSTGTCDSEPTCRARCDTGDYDACFALVDRHYVEGAPAVALLGPGCEGRHAASCRILGAAYGAGLGAPKDPRRMRELLERACGLRDEPACNMLAAVLYEGSYDSPQDEARALALFEES